MSHFCNMRSVFKPLVTYFRKILEKLRKFSLRTPEIKKKISLKHPRIKEKNKKKIGSNAKNLRKLEPQPEQTFLIKKNKKSAIQRPSKLKIVENGGVINVLDLPFPLPRGQGYIYFKLVHPLERKRNQSKLVQL